MLIVGAKGFAIEVLEVLNQNNQIENIAFFDNVSTDMPELIFNEFPLIRSFDALEKYFEKNENSFVLGVGKPEIRELLSNEIKKIGGKLVSIISPFAKVGKYSVKLGNGVCIMTGAILTGNIILGDGVLVNLNATIGHDCIIDDFVEICPAVNISGNCKIGRNTFVGTGAIILPNITIGENVVIAAGALVNKDVPDNVIAIGIPAKIKKNS